MDLSTLSPEQKYAYDKFCKGENLFISGPGGTGKTKLIEYLVHQSKSTAQAHQVCAMTGCAAILLNCNARTLHSWSGIRLCKGQKDQIISGVLKNRTALSAWRKTNILVVDEVSMMSLKIFDIIEEIARIARRSSLPFGGLQVVFTGDFFQLPPVSTTGETDTELFCFESTNWLRVFPLANHVILKTIFRQTDPLYKEILLQVRTGDLTEENKKILQGYVKREYDPEQHNGCIPTKLFPTRAKTDYLNATMFAKLKEKEFVFECDRKTQCKTFLETNKAISPEYLSIGARMTAQEIDYEIQMLLNNTSMQQTLSLKKGCVVMCTVNLDMEQGICNGSQGIIINILENGPVPLPIVKFANGVTKPIHPHYRQSEECPTIAVGQIPLCLAWALTIHKIQGATLALADIDVGGNIFEYGQTYVALSRVQSLEGLYLTAFHAHKIKANDRVRQFYSQIPDITNYESIIPENSTELKTEDYGVPEGGQNDNEQLKSETVVNKFEEFAFGANRITECSGGERLNSDTLVKEFDPTIKRIRL